MLPVAVLEELYATGEIGGITDHHLSFMGYQPKPLVFMRETAPRMAERLIELEADLVLLSPG